MHLPERSPHPHGKDRDTKRIRSSLHICRPNAAAVAGRRRGAGGVAVGGSGPSRRARSSRGHRSGDVERRGSRSHPRGWAACDWGRERKKADNFSII